MAKIGDILVSKGVISQDILEQALEVQSIDPPDWFLTSGVAEEASHPEAQPQLVATE